MIVIVVEGGIIQGVSSDSPDEIGKSIVVVDYDAEGADPVDVEKVPQGKGETADAIISMQEVGRLSIPIARFLKERTP